MDSWPPTFELSSQGKRKTKSTQAVRHSGPVVYPGSIAAANLRQAANGRLEWSFLSENLNSAEVVLMSHAPLTCSQAVNSVYIVPTPSSRRLVQLRTSHHLLGPGEVQNKEYVNPHISQSTLAQRSPGPVFTNILPRHRHHSGAHPGGATNRCRVRGCAQETRPIIWQPPRVVHGQHETSIYPSAFPKWSYAYRLGYVVYTV